MLKIGEPGKMKLEVAGGSRICRLCDEKIKKGEECLSIGLGGYHSTQYCHIHAYHIDLGNKLEKAGINLEALAESL